MIQVLCVGKIRLAGVVVKFVYGALFDMSLYDDTAVSFVTASMVIVPTVLKDGEGFSCINTAVWFIASPISVN